MSELIKVETITAMDVFTKEGGVDPILEAITKEVKKHEPDISTPAGRKEIISLATKVAKTKVILDDLGAGLVEDMKKQVKVVDASRKKIRDFLDSLKEETRKPVTDWENAEKDRVAKHEKNIAFLVEMRSPVAQGMRLGIATLKANLHILKTTRIGDEWQEFKARAEKELNTSIESLGITIEEDERREAEQAELKKLREEKEIQEKADREKRISDQAAERERLRIQSEKDLEEKDRLAREKDVNHRRSINKEVHASIKEILSRTFVEPDMIESVAKAIVVDIAQGKVPHVKVIY